MHISFCKCQRRILTTQQMKDNMRCEICQKEQKEKETVETPTEGETK